MLSLRKLMARLPRHQNRWEHLVGSLSRPTAQDFPTAGTHLDEVTAFGTNPGNLRMFRYLPSDLAADPALVVVLHGCTQTAAGYDLGAGWSTLADRYGFALLMPEQQRSNNPNGCFNWFQPGDIERGRGEALSIRQMIEKMITDTGVDRRRVFVTGLSAGGAMTSVMLACYPEVFAGGAIIAGLPYGAAANVQQAFQSMHQCPARPAREWGDLVRRAASHKGAWPRVSIWHGSADKTVIPDNAREILKQWTDVHGLAADAGGSRHGRRLPASGLGECGGRRGHRVVHGYAHGSWHSARNGRGRRQMRRGRSVPARSRHLVVLSHRKILRPGSAARHRFGRSLSGSAGTTVEYRASGTNPAPGPGSFEWQSIRRDSSTSGRSSHGYRCDHHQGPDSRGTDEGIGQRVLREKALFSTEDGSTGIAQRRLTLPDLVRLAALMEAVTAALYPPPLAHRQCQRATSKRTSMTHCPCPLLAQSGHQSSSVIMSAYDPKQTFRSGVRMFVFDRFPVRTHSALLAPGQRSD